MKEAKKALRRRMAEISAALTEAEIRSGDERIFRNFFTLPEYSASQKIFIYYSAFKEPDTKRIIERMLKEGKKVYIPAVLGSGVMEARRFSAGALEKGVFGIEAPPEDAEKAEAGELDLIVLPGVAFDGGGGRLGRGGGYYDRFLSESKAVAVGLSRETFMVGQVPKEAHDIQVDYVITEAGIKKREAR